VDDAGNVYWTESETPVIRSYRADTNRVVTVAGSIRGLADGPLARARFGGWAYNNTNLICVSGNGKHLFVKDTFGKRLWRHVDLEAGTVKTLFPWQEKQGSHFVIAKDKSGEIYCFNTAGTEPPDNPGYKKLKVAPFKTKAHYIGGLDDCALDAENMKFYWHGRGDIQVCDLKTGEVAKLNPGPKRDKWGSTGSFEGWTPCCPTGMSISPGGRYLFVGGGDADFIWRFDLESKYVKAFGWDAKMTDLMFRETGANFKGAGGGSSWPAACVFLPDGKSAVWATCWGLYRLEPAK
jgi:hypothetical protein